MSSAGSAGRPRLRATEFQAALLEFLEHRARFRPAYSAIRMLADVSLNANGYRTLTHRPGHHQTAIQTPPLTIGLAAQTVQALALQSAVRAWLKANRAALL